MPAILSVARALVRAGTKLRKRATCEMNLSEYLAHFGDVMTAANHRSSWGVAGATISMNGSSCEGGIFVFVSAEPDVARRAEQVLGAAGLLCETPLHQEGESVVTETLAVLAITSGLRALGGRKA